MNPLNDANFTAFGGLDWADAKHDICLQAAGSFFKNPVVSIDEAECLRKRFTGLPTWPAGVDHAKLSAAWMIDHCGWKGVQQNGAAVSSQHALVLVNQGPASGRQILELSGKTG